MFRHPSSTVIALLAVALAAPCVQAKPEDGARVASAATETAQGAEVGEAVGLMTLAEFRERRSFIETEMRPGGAYMEISRSDRADVVDSLAMMERLMERYNGVEGMNQEARIRLFNEQEKVNAILTVAERDSRLFCQRRGRVGTHFRSTHCETYAERMRRMEEQRNLVQRGQPFVLPEGGGFSGGLHQGGGDPGFRGGP